MQRVGMILDVTHLSDTSMAQALDVFSGRVLASHHNCRALVPNVRQISDEQIKRLIQRSTVIGVALDAWMLYPGWVRGKTQPEVVGLEAIVDHVDRVCQFWPMVGRLPVYWRLYWRSQVKRPKMKALSEKR